MRPDEFYRQEGYRWQYITTCRSAYNEGIERANAEAAAVRELDREDF
jgi:hypothetical protein